MRIFEVSVSVAYIYLLIFLSKAVNLKKIDYIKNIIITILVGVIFYEINQIACIISILVILIYLIGKVDENYKKSLFVSLIAIIMQSICSYFVGSVLETLPLQQSLFDTIFGVIISYSVLGVFIFGLGVVIFEIVNIRDIDFNENNLYINSVIAIFIVFCAIVYYNIYSLQSDSLTVTGKYAILIILMSLIVILALFVGIKGFYNDRDLKIKDNELKALQNYINETEDAYLEMRKFKHDYINILSSIAGYICDEDMKGLEDYFNKKIAPLNNTLENESLKLASLKNVKATEIKGILTIKTIQAQNKGINIDIEILEEIESISWDTILACRGIGILMDNAIEAAEECNYKKINLALIKKEKSKIIIIQNTYKHKNINVKKIYEQSYSTKGNDRGLGLSTLKESISKANNIILDTQISEEFFTQIITIQDI
ncbi:GHKL domain-containing protein [Clostridium thermobutyricum]|uniref:Sensory histidine kinase DcuS n=1 Tax=Clostridium thermobutyricum DSM 4928 TaxID=1121339 RepID=A0A1V4SZ13_9CLOT|nr:GHKL domain-containing protein [Clostridium thermobutyricum]OPX49130.1 sensory histidine kinase DcuS [Clostridium thermobutyricum DSM 4928]